LKQVRVRRDLGKELRDTVAPSTTKKKNILPSPYDLEHANHYLRNTFKMEVIMSLQEQRKQRPAKYKIKNIKRVKRNPSIKRTRNHDQDGQIEVDLDYSE
jgi:uncharacterized membrane protein